MRKLISVCGAGALVLLAMTLGCESTDPTVPADGQLVVTASPSTVTIDVQQDQESAETTIVAQAFTAGGLALSGVGVAFTTTGGQLASATNVCDETSGACTISAEACASDDECPTVPPLVQETNSNGVVIDVLTLTLADPTSVDVTANSGALSQSVTVTKNVTDGNVLPTAAVVGDPLFSQSTNATATFDGRGSSDPDGVISCYQWEITSDNPATAAEIVQGPTTSLLTRDYADEQRLTVTLRVSDQVDDPADPFCDPATVAPADRFSPNSDFMTYDIVCDRTGPIAIGSGNQSVLLVGGQATVRLDGSNSRDGESGIATYSWTCGNGTTPIPVEEDGQPGVEIPGVVDCIYNFAQDTPFQAVLTVTNGCEMTDQDIDNITVNNP